MFKTFDNNLNQHGYKEILLNYLYPFILDKFQGRAYVHQDNDQKHRSKLCMRTCFRFGINIVIFLNSKIIKILF